MSSRRRLGTVAVVISVFMLGSSGCTGNGDGCDDGGSCVSLVGGTAATVPSVVDRLGEAELAQMMAVVVRNAVMRNPDGAGTIQAMAYRIGDAFGAADGEEEILFDPEVTRERMIPASVRASISQALSPGMALFVPADPTKGMLLLALPASREDGSWAVTYQQACGGDPSALCGSGGRFRMDKVNGAWTVVDIESGWIS